MAVSVCCGPVIGGALTQYINWRTYELVTSKLMVVSVAEALSRLVFLDVRIPRYIKMRSPPLTILIVIFQPVYALSLS